MKNNRNIIFSIITLVITVLLLEFSLYVLFAVFPKQTSHIWARPEMEDPYLGFRANSERLEHDAKGFRNYPSLQDADIVAMGDSQTYGYNVSYTESWPYQLSVKMSKKVYNMAFGGYSPPHSLLLYDEALALKPKIIIEAFYTGNDLFEAYNLSYIDKMTPKLRSKDEKVLLATSAIEGKKSLSEMIEEADHLQQDATNFVFLKKYLRDKTALYKTLRAFFFSFINKSDWYSWFFAKWHATVVPDLVELFEQNGMKTALTPVKRLSALDLNDVRVSEGLNISIKAIRALADKSRKDGVEFYVLVLPTKELAFKDAVTRRGEASENYSLTTSYEESVIETLKNALEEFEIAYIEALPTLRKLILKGVSPYPVSEDGHLNNVGNRAIAETIYKHLSQV